MPTIHITVIDHWCLLQFDENGV